LSAVLRPDFYAANGVSRSDGEPSGLDLSDRPFVAAANMVAAVLLEILRPLCWEAVILLYLLALFTAE
jgi:hypothetical protein